MICTCGCNLFVAHQVSYHSVVVDGNNAIVEDMGIEDGGVPYGDYICLKCHKEYEEI